MGKAFNTNDDYFDNTTDRTLAIIQSGLLVLNDIK
jgi:hypothetical protein